jgi:hypothetical protein
MFMALTHASLSTTNRQTIPIDKAANASMHQSE